MKLSTLAALLGILATLGCVTPDSGSPDIRFVAIWATSQQIPEPENALAPADMTDATIRQIVHITHSASAVRVKFSNVFGTAPLHIASAHIANALKPGTTAIDPASDIALRFNGQPDVIIPAGADYLSDPAPFTAPAFADIAISIHLDTAPAQQTGHPGSRTTTFYVHGDQVSAADLPGARQVAHWYQIAAIDTPTMMRDAAAIAIIGDSITDGRGSTTDGNNRWPDQLAARLQASPTTANLSVLNLGIGGNRLLNDGKGPNALARFDRDILAQAGVRYVIVLEGINDLGTLPHDASPQQHTDLVARMIDAYAQMVARAHARGLKIYGATILPYMGTTGYAPTAVNEADRQAVNAWVRAPGHFDAVIDFDAAMRDPAQPDRLNPAYDTGDHLHPNVAGYAAMAAAVPLALFHEDAAAAGTYQAPLYTPPVSSAPLRVRAR
ncbi:MAG: SGNH/GDSL hydrolase family protein [Pseudomonadota bacterium]